MTVRQLVEDYDRRIRVTQAMIESENSPKVISRLKVKQGCYRAFIAELQRCSSV